MTVHRPPTVRPHHRKTNVYSHNFKLVWKPKRKLIAHQCCDQLIAVKTGHPLTSITWPLFSFEVIRWQITSFKWYFFPMIHVKYVVFMSLWPCTIRILISNWSRTRKFSQFFKSTGGKDLILPWSRVGHALCSIFILWLVKIWQVSSCGKIMQHLESCLLWQLKLKKFCVNLWCF